MLDRIEAVLDSRVRPTLRAHDGDVQVQLFSDGVLVVKLLGQCSCCPSAQATTEDIIRAELMSAIPEIRDVELDIGVDAETLAMVRKVLNHEV